MNELNCIECGDVLRKLKKENSRLLGRIGGLQRANNRLKKERDELKRQLCVIQTAALTNNLPPKKFKSRIKPKEKE